MKTALMRFCKALLLLVPIVGMVLFLQSALFYHDDHNAQRFQDFYTEPKNSLDLVMMGASDMYAGFSPVYAYEYSGLTSYLYASDSNPGSLYLSQLKEILKQQDPQMIVVEVHGFLYDDEEQHEEAGLRRYVENIPLSFNKLVTLLRHDYEDDFSSLFPFFKYHSQWTMSAEEMAEKYRGRPGVSTEPSLLKGASTNTSLYLSEPRYDVSEDDTATPLAPLALDFLTEFLEYCRSEEIHNVLFLRIPRNLMNSSQYERYTRSNEVENIVNSYGFDFLDLEQNVDDVGIEYEYDFYNHEHLNIYGQQKLTEYLCDVLLDEYALSPMEQTAENRQRWDESIDYLYAYNEAAAELMEAGIDEQLYETPQLLEELQEYMD